MPRFAEAAAAARSFGFDPVIRLGGGRAVAYDQSCLVVDLIAPPTFFDGHLAAFDAAAACFRSALSDLGVDARIGPVPNEYCLGDHSVNARGEVKLVGIAQRVMRGARLLTASLVMESPGRLRPVVSAVYDAMKLEWAPSTLGSLRDEGVIGSLEEIERDLSVLLQQRYLGWATPQSARSPP